MFVEITLQRRELHWLLRLAYSMWAAQENFKTRSPSNDSARASTPFKRDSTHVYEVTRR
jgi:hypothetical protein